MKTQVVQIITKKTDSLQFDVSTGWNRKDFSSSANDTFCRCCDVMSVCFFFLPPFDFSESDVWFLSYKISCSAFVRGQGGAGSKGWWVVVFEIQPRKVEFYSEVRASEVVSKCFCSLLSRAYYDGLFIDGERTHCMIIFMRRVVPVLFLQLKKFCFDWVSCTTDMYYLFWRSRIVQMMFLSFCWK